MTLRFFRIYFAIACLCGGAPEVWAAKNFNVMNNTTSFFFVNGTTGNTGVGTTTPQGGFVVTNGNVGIGTWAPSANLSIIGTGTNYFGTNVGINTLLPGTALDVNGAARMTGFNLSTAPTNGYVLTSDANGNGTWVASPAGGGWTQSGTNVTTSGANNVGIGTTTPQGALVITNGNVGIGTWAATGGSLIVATGNVGIGTAQPSQVFEVGTKDFDITSTGNVGINTSAPTGVEIEGLNVGIGTFRTSTSALTVMSGNVGIGTWVPGAALQIVGSGNVGIATSNPGQQLDVGSGRIRAVGIGTSVPQELCRKSDGTIGFFDGAWAGVCN